VLELGPGDRSWSLELGSEASSRGLELDLKLRDGSWLELEASARNGS